MIAAAYVISLLAAAVWVSWRDRTEGGDGA
jgi:hypothetical protein